MVQYLVSYGYRATGCFAQAVLAILCVISTRLRCVCSLAHRSTWYTLRRRSIIMVIDISPMCVPPGGAVLMVCWWYRTRYRVTPNLQFVDVNFVPSMTQRIFVVLRLLIGYDTQHYI